MASSPTVALVTGAAGNIGRAVAIGLARSGSQVVACDLESATAGLEETAALCSKANPSAPDTLSLPFDVTDPPAVAAAFDRAEELVGPPQQVFNNAGFQGSFANLLDYDLADMERVLAVNVGGVFTVLQAAGRLMASAGRGGSIVNMASMAGVSGAPNMSAYSASKAAVIGLTKSAAKDLAPWAIRVNSVSPGFIGPGVMWDNQVQQQADVVSPYYADTPTEVAQQMIDMVPLRRYGSLDEVANAVLFLLGSQSSFINSVNLEISGGGA